MGFLMQLQWWWWRIQYMGVGEARAIFPWPRGKYRNDFSLRWLSRDEGETQTVHNTEAENKSGDCSGVISRVGQKQQSDYFSLWKSSRRYCNPWKPRQFFGQSRHTAADWTSVKRYFVVVAALTVTGRRRGQWRKRGKMKLSNDNVISWYHLDNLGKPVFCRIYVPVYKSES